MGFSLVLFREHEEVSLIAVEETKQATLQVSLDSFSAWGIFFRDLARLLYWLPHAPLFSQTVFNLFREPLAFANPSTSPILFQIEPGSDDKLTPVQLRVWQPSNWNESAVSIQENTALPFLNLIALGLLQKSSENFRVTMEDLNSEELFYYHGELRKIEDHFRATGLSPIWITPALERILMVSRFADAGIPYPEGIPAPLLRAAEEKALRIWSQEETEEFIRVLADIQYGWQFRYQEAPKDSAEAVTALQNWIFSFNLLGFLDRYLAGVLPTRMPNPSAPLLAFLLEHFFIAQWESDLWTARRSGLEPIYQQLLLFLFQ